MRFVAARLVIPAKAGIQLFQQSDSKMSFPLADARGLDARLRGHDNYNFRIAPSSRSSASARRVASWAKQMRT